LRSGSEDLPRIDPLILSLLFCFEEGNILIAVLGGLPITF